MSKTLLAIAGMGTAACVLLSFAMQRMVELRSARPESPFAAPVAARFGARLAGPVQIDERHDADGLRLVVSVRVVDWHAAARLGSPIAAEVLLLAQRSGTFPREVVVELSAPGESPVVHRLAGTVKRAQSSMAPSPRVAPQPPAPRAR